ncbi:MAG: glycosyl transferase family protein [Solirubrobacterales bacterium]|jgi:putative flippase GtrA|nr:glycosyl transferase family protein [Solirubrobacterales bacterium]
MTFGAQLRSFVVIGVLCTLAYAAIYAALRAVGLAPLAANAIGLAATMGANFVANRHLTFQAGHEPLLPQLAGYAVAYALGVGASSVVLLALASALGHPGGLLDTAAAVVSGLAATAVRFVLMRIWVFRDAATQTRPDAAAEH